MNTLTKIEESHAKIDEKNEKEIKRLIFFEEEFKINKIKWEEERHTWIKINYN